MSTEEDKIKGVQSVTHSGLLLALEQRRGLKDDFLRQFCKVGGGYISMRQYRQKYKGACLKTWQAGKGQ